MKKLYEFKLPKVEKVKETTTEKNDQGQEVSTTTEVEKTVDKNFFIKRPTRRLFDEAELYYGVKLSEGIKAGLLTRALLAKRFSNDGGVLGEKEKEQFQELYEDLFEKQVEHQALSLKTKEERSAEENEKFEELQDWLKEARSKVQEFEMQQSSLYDQTAENRARNKTILWWVLYLAYQIDGEGNEEPFFGSGDFDSRILKYDEYEEEEEDFNLDVINKFFYYISFWYVSKTSDPEQFIELIKYAEQADLIERGETDVTFEEETEEEVEEKAEEVSEKEEPDKDKEGE
tara:strand:+ start:639 stop:1502 length:864 start_codon:yes stop_codon:yes gene_type:complete